MLNRFFYFDQFLTPTLVRWAFWLGILAMVITFTVTLKVTLPYGVDSVLLAMSVISHLAGLLAWRVLCEVFLLVFKLLERLTEIRDRMPGSEAGSANYE